MTRLTEEGRERGFCVTERHWRKTAMALRAPVHVCMFGGAVPLIGADSPG